MEITGLNSPGERRVNLAIGDLIAVILQLGLYLLQAEARFVVVAGRCGTFVVESRDAISLSLDAGIFRLCGCQLHLVIRGVQLGHELSGLHPLTLLLVDAGDGAGHLKTQTGIIAGDNTAWKLEHGTGTGHLDGIQTHGSHRFFGRFPIAA